jgi:DNA mismatch endonuclease (patch repair protein)
VVQHSGRRSDIMRAVRSRDTQPEMTVRRVAHRMGFRFRLHRRDLPGSPDLVFPSRHKVIFVHGCFWHGHDCRRGSRSPVTNADYWRSKIARNVARDSAVAEALERAGWQRLVLWECELGNVRSLGERIGDFLEGR